ncbi:hypothetical protein AA313_de0210421 [Arthrobotrys entomopaga]|nr:hypothetical protein AA313_de0210421 [Arthrobotrys entomopaga]
MWSITPNGYRMIAALSILFPITTALSNIQFTNAHFNALAIQYRNVYIYPFLTAAGDMYAFGEKYPIHSDDEKLFINSTIANSFSIRKWMHRAIDDLHAAGETIHGDPIMSGGKFIDLNDAMEAEDPVAEELAATLRNMRNIIKVFADKKKIAINKRAWVMKTISPTDMIETITWNAVGELRDALHKCCAVVDRSVKMAIVWMFNGQYDPMTSILTLQPDGLAIRLGAMDTVIEALFGFIENVEDGLRQILQLMREDAAGDNGTERIAPQESLAEVLAMWDSWADTPMVDTKKLKKGVESVTMVRDITQWYAEFLVTIRDSMEGMFDAVTLEQED